MWRRRPGGASTGEGAGATSFLLVPKLLLFLENAMIRQAEPNARGHSPGQRGGVVWKLIKTCLEGIDDGQEGKAGKILIAGDDFSDPMLQAEGRDVGIVHQVARHAGLFQHDLHNIRVAGSLLQEYQGRGGQDALQVCQGHRQRHRRIVNPGVGNHSQKFINAWPGDDPGQRAFRQFGENSPGNPVKWTAPNLCGHQDIGIHCLHCSPAVHEVEQFVAIKQVNTRLSLCLPGL